MVAVWIILWILTLIILEKDYKTESTRWLAGVTFFTGLGSFSVIVEEFILKRFIGDSEANKEIIRLLYATDGIVSVIVHYLVPYCMLLYGLSYANIVPKHKKKIIYSILFIPVILSLIILPIRSNSLKTPDELILYFRQLALWTLPYMLSSIFFLFYSYIKEKSYIMKKYKLLTLLIIGPCISCVILFNVILRAFGLDNNWRNFAILIPMEFMGFLYFANKYGILGVKLKFERYKFAFEDMFELVSDSFVALDENLNVVEFNELFSSNFLMAKRKYKNLQQMLIFSNIPQYANDLIDLIKDSKENNSNIKEISINSKDEVKYFEVKASPIIANSEHFGSVLLFKDVTVYKKNLELIKQNQFQIIERERLLSLSQLIGGVAHNLKTPLLSSAGGIHIIKRDTGKLNKYLKENFIESTEITQTIDEINDWEQRIVEYLKYMSDVISAVKGQVTEYREDSEDSFSIKEIIDKITLLMAYELKKNNYILSKELNIDYSEMIRGDVNSLVQVLDNVISNSIEASKEGDKIILGAFKENKDVIFYVKNYGDEIPANIQSKIFNKMVTTKGKNGTGLGLYISKSIIKGRFNGEIYFDTNNEETTFFVKIPLIEGVRYE